MADVLDAGFGARNSSKVVAIVVTDGRSSEKRDFVYESAERLKEVVDIVIAVGVNMKKEVRIYPSKKIYYMNKLVQSSVPIGNKI